MYIGVECSRLGTEPLEGAVTDHSFKEVLYFTLGWGALAVTLLAAQPGPFMHGMPHFVRPAEAAQTTATARPARIQLAASMESAE